MERGVKERKTRGGGVGLRNLKSVRERQALTQRELESATGVGKSTINDLENGKRGAQARTIRKLAAALGVTPAELVG